MAKSKPVETETPPLATEPVVADIPAELPEPAPEPAPEPVYDHTVLYGVESVVSDEREYHIRVGGLRYTHVGDTPDGRWIYRPDY